MVVVKDYGDTDLGWPMIFCDRCIIKECMCKTIILIVFIVMLIQAIFDWKKKKLFKTSCPRE